ncbi:MAG TPA: hypothetical protein VGM76_04205 [Lacipirellulaceae bacterium]
MPPSQVQLTSEQRQAILATPGEPIHIEDPETQKVYLLVEEGAFPQLEEAYIRQGLDLARQQIANGQISTATAVEVIAEAKRRSDLAP